MSVLKREINRKARAIRESKVTPTAEQDAEVLRDTYLRVSARAFCGKRLLELKAIEMLLEGSTQAEAARAVNLPKSNVRYWWNRFVKRMKESATRSE